MLKRFAHLLILVLIFSAVPALAADLDQPSMVFAQKTLADLDDSQISAETIFRLSASELETRKPKVMIAFMKDILKAASTGQLSGAEYDNTLKVSAALKEKISVDMVNEPDSKFFPKALSTVERFERELEKRYVALDGPLTDSIETTLGKQFHESILGSYPLSAEEDQALVESLAEKVFNLAKKERKYGEYKVFAIKMEQDGQEVPNAFCAPGGYVYVTKGLMKIIKNDPGILTFVVGHEAGHHVNEDTAKKLKLSIGLMPLQLIPGVKKLIARYIHAPIGRKAEYKADAKGTDYTVACNLDGKSGITFLEVLTGLFGNLDPGAYGDHPSNSDRIAAIEKHLAN